MNWRSSFVKLYQSLAGHYGQTFSKGMKQQEVVAHMNHWQKTLHENKISPQEMQSVFEQIINRVEFRKFPPNPSEFVASALFARAVTTHHIPSPDQAFEQACTGSINLHPLAKHVRKTIGAWTLRTQTNAALRSRFITLYTEAAEQLGRGSLKLPTVEQPVTATEQEVQILTADQLVAEFSNI